MSEAAPVATGKPGRTLCPLCGELLEWVPRPPYLNREQWDAIKAGDYFIEVSKCREAECCGKKGRSDVYRYFRSPSHE